MDEMLIVVVGDKETILPSLKELGYEIIELDANGDTVQRSKVGGDSARP
jgi:zinc protease